VAAALLASVLDQVLDHGLFHVDLHPGNVLVQRDGSLGLLDLGSVGRLDGSTRAAFGRLMAALGSSDSLMASDSLLELLDRPSDIDERRLERDLGALIVRYTAPAVSVGAAAFAELFRVVTAHRLPIPAQVAALFRTFATLESTLALIAPSFDLVAEARAAGRRRMSEALSPPRMRRSAEEELASLVPLLRRLPRRVDRIADAVEHGRLTIGVRLFADARDRRLVTGLVHLTLTALLGAVAGIMAVLFLGMTGGPQLNDTVRLFSVFGYGLLVVSVVLVLRVLVVVLRPDRG
jgi:ubiquinone biosynthesis protein